MTTRIAVSPAEAGGFYTQQLREHFLIPALVEPGHLHPTYGFSNRIRMNALTPGIFLTEQNRHLLTNPDGNYTERGAAVIRQTPFKRFGQPEELTGALVFLLSDASRFVTGSQLVIDGGFSIFSGV